MERCDRCACTYDAFVDGDAELWAEAAQAAASPCARQPRPWPTFGAAQIRTATRARAPEPSDELPRCRPAALSAVGQRPDNRTAPATAPGDRRLWPKCHVRGEAASGPRRQVEAACRPMQVLLGGMHRVVMTLVHGQASDLARPAPSRAPWSSESPLRNRLATGELYVEVVPGHPFTVATANARLDITGTSSTSGPM